ncbi:unnamed protein product [Chrysoparadoxa australica]
MASACKEEGNKLLADGKFTQAVEKYSEAITMHPTAIFLGNRAMAYLNLENYGLAILDAEEALTLDPDYLKAFYRRASANMALGKYKLALKDFKQVARLRPTDREARAKYRACEKLAKEAAFAEAIQLEDAEPMCVRMIPSEVVVEASYDGPIIEDDGMGPITAEFVQAMMERFKDQKMVAKRFVVRILTESYRLLREQPSLMELTVPETGLNGGEGHFTVCGDTHGQYYDVLNIFQLNGLPSAANPYLFNGDFVDRGSFSLEVVLTFLAWKLACPEGMYLTRGNHESKNMNKIYGFEGEVKHKLDASVMTMFSEVFSCLPLAATINSKVFIVHGGLPSADNVSLEQIAKVDRFREPPDSGLMSDLMWSDPQPFPGRSPSKRGVGMAFGADITNSFLDFNGLELLVRSHEVKEEGFLVEHGGKCITVFSAPNYCDQMGNKGAFIRFGPDLQPQFTQYEAVSHPAVRPMAYAGFPGANFLPMSTLSLPSCWLPLVLTWPYYQGWGSLEKPI